MSYMGTLERGFPVSIKDHIDRERLSDGSYGRPSSYASSETSQILGKKDERNLRRRNTIVVILMAIAVLAALAVIIGIAMFFTYHKGR